jgi:hypothetical protein
LVYLTYLNVKRIILLRIGLLKRKFQAKRRRITFAGDLVSEGGLFSKALNVEVSDTTEAGNCCEAGSKSIQ